MCRSAEDKNLFGMKWTLIFEKKYAMKQSYFWWCLRVVTQEILTSSVHDVDRKNTSFSSCSYSRFFCSIEKANRLVWRDGSTIMGGLHVALMTDWECRGLSQAANWEDLNDCMDGETSKLFITAAKTGFLSKYCIARVSVSYSLRSAAVSLQTLSQCLCCVTANWRKKLQMKLISTRNCFRDKLLLSLFLVSPHRDQSASTSKVIIELQSFGLYPITLKS